MRKIILFSSLSITLLSGLPIGARSVFSYSDEQGLAGQVRCTQDLLVLKDGSQRCGALKKMPVLMYSFGPITLDLDQISLISAVPNSWGKWEVITVDGSRYVASFNDNQFTLENGAYPLSQVDYILVKPRSYRPAGGAFQVSFVNGDEIPTAIIDQQISLSYGKGTRTLSTNEIISVSYKGGLFGTIRNQKGEAEELGFGLVKSPFITVLLHGSQEGRKLQWNTIYGIKKNLDAPVVPTPVTKAENPSEGWPEPLLTFTEADEAELIALGEDFNLDELGTEKPESESAKTPDEEFNFSFSDEEDIRFLAMVDFTEEEKIPAPSREEQEAQGLQFKYENDEELSKSVLSSMQGVYEGMAYIPAKNDNFSGFYIKTHRVTNKEYQQFVNTVHYRYPSHWIKGRIPAGQENEPVVNITYKDALLYSVWAGKRLPTSDELEFALRGNQLADAGGNIQEWTATPDTKSEAGPVRSHLLFGKGAKNAMHNDTGDGRTGFRVAIDAQLINEP